jgi:hypothetical protein
MRPVRLGDKTNLGVGRRCQPNGKPPTAKLNSQDGSLCLFVLQLGLCIGFVCGAWLFIALRGLAAPRPPSELDQPQHELVACACSQVEQSALSATAPGEAVPVAHCCDADVAFAARRHISSPSAGLHTADFGSKGRQAVSGSSTVDAATGVAGKGVSGTWVEVDALAFGSGGGRRVEAARRRARALLKAEVAAEEDALEARELARAMADSAVDAVQSSCADFAGAVAVSMSGVGAGAGDESYSSRPSGLFSGPDGCVRAWKPPVGWVAPPVWSREPGLDPVGGDRWGVKVRLRMPQSGSLLVWVRVAPVLRVDRGEPMAGGEHLPVWRQLPVGDVTMRWDELPVADFVSEVLRVEGQAGLQRYARVAGRGAGAGSHGRSGRRGRRRGGRGLGAEGLAEGLARMDRVTFSTLKPTFRVVSE